MSLRLSHSKDFLLVNHIPEKQLMFKTPTDFCRSFSFFLKSLIYKGQKPKKNLWASKIDSEYQLKCTIFYLSDLLYRII